LSNGVSRSSLIIWRTNWCPSWLKGSRSAKNWSTKLQKMLREKKSKVVLGIPNKILRIWKIKKGQLKFKSLI
jgi:hypothetical protein